MTCDGDRNIPVPVEFSGSCSRKTISKEVTYWLQVANSAVKKKTTRQEILVEKSTQAA